MATIAKPKGQKELEEQQKQYVQDQGGQAGLTTGSPVGPVSSGGAPTTDQVNPNPSDSNRSGLFTSFEKFKQANLPKAGALGARLGGDYTQAGDEHLTGIGEESEAFGSEVADNTFRLGDEFLTKNTLAGFRDQGSSVVDVARTGEETSQEQKDIFGDLSNVLYEGPTDFNAEQKQRLEREKRRVDEIGLNLRSDEGRKQQLKEHFQPTIEDYSRQASELDNLILKTDPAVQELYDAGSYVDALALDEAYGSALSQAESLGTNVSDLHDTLRTDVRGDLTSTQDKFYSAVDTRLTELGDVYGEGTGQAREYIENIMKKYEDGGILELSPEELDFLGLKEGDILYNEFDAKNLGDKEVFNRGQAVSEMEAKKLAELNALSKIAGTDTYGADLVTNQAGKFEGNEFELFDDKLNDAEIAANKKLAENIGLKGTGESRQGEGKWFVPTELDQSVVTADLNLLERMKEQGMDLSDIESVDKYLEQLKQLGVYDLDPSDKKKDWLTETGHTPTGEDGSNWTSYERAYNEDTYHTEHNTLSEDARAKTKTIIEDLGMDNIVKAGVDTPEEFEKLKQYLEDKERLMTEIV